MYDYFARVTNVVDGDTFDAEVDLGFDVFKKTRFRLVGIDTPETWRPKSLAEKAHGKMATEFVKSLIEGKTVTIISTKIGAYNRYDAVVILEDDSNLAELLKLNDFEKRSDYEV